MSTEQQVFKTRYQDFGEIVIRPFSIASDSKVLHDWVNRDYAVFWGMQQSSLDDVVKEYTKLMEPEDYDVFVGEYKGTIAFVLERYVPTLSLIHI